MTLPLVSVCFVTYNHAQFVGDALKSAIDQDYPNFEMVIADDGSTDGTEEIVQSFARSNPEQVVLLPTRRNEGIPGIVSNYNRALAKCRGKYIAFLEGDDVFLPGKITKQVQWLETDERRVLCGHDVEVFDSASNKRFYLMSEITRLRHGQGADLVVRHNVPFTTVSMMIRATTIPSHGFDDRLRIVLDWKFWIDCLAAGGHFGYVDGVLARYRRHATNITKHHFATRQDDQFVTLALVESRYPHLVASCRYGRARVLCTSGVGCLRRGNRVQARQYLLNALAQSGRPPWKAAAALFLTVLPGRLVLAILKMRRSSAAVA
jgi:glycosyltransferase involved in cell wall biosynthesis